VFRCWAAITGAGSAAGLLSGEGHDSISVNVELLADIRLAFGADAIQSADLVAKLTADPEEPWVEWKHGKPLSQKQLASLLRPSGITSETVHPIGHSHATGYKQGGSRRPGRSLAHRTPFPKRARSDGSKGSSDFRSVREDSPHGSKNANLSNSHVDARLHESKAGKRSFWPKTGPPTLCTV
jgi:Protein of unknown function (DUF3631)